MQKSIDNGTTVLLADEVMVLTDGYSFGTVVRLGKETADTAWYEVTAEEAEAMQAEEVTDEDYRAALRELGVKV